MSDTVDARFVIDDRSTVRRVGSTVTWPCSSLSAARGVVRRQALLLAQHRGDALTVAVDTPSGSHLLRATHESVTELGGIGSRTAEPTGRTAEAERTEAPRRTHEAAGRPARRHADRGATASEPKRTRRRSPVRKSTIAAAAAIVLGVPVVASLAWDRHAASTADAHRAAAVQTAPSLPMACLGRAALDAGIPQGSRQASESTIQQNGLTVPSPGGAAAAAAAYMRLRTAAPAPAGRDAALNELLAPGATPAARTVPPGAPGWATTLDMSKARWKIVSGNGSAADVALLLTQTGTNRGVAGTPTQFVALVSLQAVNGRWLLKDVTSSKLTPVDFTDAPYFANTEACS